MTEYLQQTAEEALGAEFWAQPEDALDASFGLIYAQVVAVMRDEFRDRGGSVLDLLLIERMAFMYAYLRMREAMLENGLTDRTRREMNKDWLELATAMKKMWNSEDKEDITEIVKKKVEKSIQTALKALPTAEAIKLQGILVESFEANGL